MFRNAAPDLPNSVGCRTAAGGDSLFAWIEGAARRIDAPIDFPMRRVAC